MRVLLCLLLALCAACNEASGDPAAADAADVDSTDSERELPVIPGMGRASLPPESDAEEPEPDQGVAGSGAMPDVLSPEEPVDDPHDLDGDGTPNRSDRCPIGSDEDADNNGFPDLCDQLLWEIEIEPQTMIIDDTMDNITVSGRLGVDGEPMSMASDPITESGELTITAAAQPLATGFLGSAIWQPHASLLAEASDGTVFEWSAAAEEGVDLRDAKLSRYSLSTEMSVYREGDSTHLTLSGRWAIHGYEP